MAEKLEALALSRQEEERKLEILSQQILAGQMEASKREQSEIKDQSKRLADQLKMAKTENLRRDLLGHASQVLVRYQDCLAQFHGIDTAESSFSLDKMMAIMSEVCTYYEVVALADSLIDFVV